MGSYVEVKKMTLPLAEVPFCLKAQNFPGFEVLVPLGGKFVVFEATKMLFFFPQIGAVGERNVRELFGKQPGDIKLFGNLSGNHGVVIANANRLYTGK